MDEIRSRLSDLEVQVSSIKDPALRKIAFEKLLEHSLGGTGKKKAVKTVSATKSPKKKASNQYYSESMVGDPVKRMNITGSLVGFPSFKNCKSKIEAYLWVLAYAKSHKIKELNNHEIAYILTKKLYKPTKYSTVYGIRKKVKEGLVILDPDSQCWIITPDGEDYLKSLKTV